MTTTAQAAPRTFADAQEILAAALPGYTRRPEQERLAMAIERAIAEDQIILAQAGCGTGKSLGALIPAILHSVQSGLRVIVAPTTKALQRQYQESDLPFLKEHLGVSFTWAILKGRANYLCLNAALQRRDLSPAQREALDVVRPAFEQGNDDDNEATELPTGDREELPVMTDREWSEVSVGASECPGRSECPFGTVCFAERARDKALSSNVTVTNTAYLMQDRKLRMVATDDEGEPVIKLLGDYGMLIIDEAHNIVDIATDALSDTIGEHALKRLASDSAKVLSQFGGEGDDAMLDGMAILWTGLRQAFDFYVRSAGKTTGDPAPLGQLGAWLPFIRETITEIAGSLATLERKLRAARKLMTEKEDKARAISALKRAGDWRARMEAFASDDPSYVRWAEQHDDMVRGQRERRLYLRSAPLSPADFMATIWADEIPVVMMSATLAVGNDWGHLERWTALEGEPRKARFDAGSPFDFARQALLYVPGKETPQPRGSTRQAASAWGMEATSHLVLASGGGALLLFTSRSEMDRSFAALAPRFRKAGLLCMRQGDASPGELKSSFAADGNAVLWGLKTYMEGIDIQGLALRLVTLDKLPFPVPSDLLFAARSELLDRTIRPYAGFDKLSIPTMSLTLIQAFGRLIRHRDDMGLVAILDSALEIKSYGKRILTTLPLAPKTNDMEQAAAFLSGIKDRGGE